MRDNLTGVVLLVLGGIAVLLACVREIRRQRKDREPNGR